MATCRFGAGSRSWHLLFGGLRLLDRFMAHAFEARERAMPCGTAMAVCMQVESVESKAIRDAITVLPMTWKRYRNYRYMYRYCTTSKKQRSTLQLGLL